MKPAPEAKPPHIVLPLGRNLSATVRDPTPCGLSDKDLRICGFNESGTHKEVEQLILGNYKAFGLVNNFDSPNQTARYDVLGGMKEFSNDKLRAEVRVARAGWTLTEADISWIGGGPVGVASGLIYISSGRADWFAEHGLLSPLVIWCLATGRPCDIITDLEEHAAYHKAITDTEKTSELAFRLGQYGELRNLIPGLAAAPDPEAVKKTWVQGQISAFLSVRAGQLDDQKKALLPRGFGFNRFVGMAWMRQRFTGFCATVDDNSFMFKEGIDQTADAMEWLFTGTNVSTRVAAVTGKAMAVNNWLAIAFSPCTKAVSDRTAASEMMTGFSAVAPAFYTGAGISVNTLECPSPRIIQQLTVWNAACFAAQPVNYDHALVTGKEDVEFYRRLLDKKAATRDLLFLDNTLHVVKCTSSGKPNIKKERQTIKALLENVKRLSPCFARAVQLQDDPTLRQIEGSFYANSDAREKAGDGWKVELVKRMNMMLEQLLVP